MPQFRKARIPPRESILPMNRFTTCRDHESFHISVAQIGLLWSVYHRRTHVPISICTYQHNRDMKISIVWTIFIRLICVHMQPEWSLLAYSAQNFVDGFYLKSWSERNIVLISSEFRSFESWSPRWRLLCMKNV